MKNRISKAIAAALPALLLAACSGDAVQEPEESGTRLSFEFTHPGQTRATDSGFEAGDCAGVFVTAAGTPLDIAGNTFTNLAVTFSANGWQTAKPIFWDKGKYNVFAYYPRSGAVESVYDYPFTVSLDQSAPKSMESLSGYEASDFLYGSAKGVEASAAAVRIPFRHLLSKLTVSLVKGPDFEGDIPEDAVVYVHNTVPDATVDLEAGVATKAQHRPVKTIKAAKTARGVYTAVVVPQMLANRVPLVEILSNGVSYLYESKFIFKPGTNHNVTLVVDKNPDQLKIEIGAEITDWTK